MSCGFLSILGFGVSDVSGFTSILCFGGFVVKGFFLVWRKKMIGRWFIGGILIPFAL